MFTFFKTPINWWFVGFLGLLIASLWITHVARVNSAVKENTTKITTTLNTEYQKRLDKSVELALLKTKKLQEEADKLKQDKYAKLETANRKLTTDIVGLQQRDKRPTPSASVASNSTVSGAPCTAAQLYREDAEFLTREAHRAESVMVERDYYYNRYISVEKGLNAKSQ